MILKENEIIKVIEKLEGTCKSLDYIIEYFDLEISIDDLENQLLDYNVERCEICDYWITDLGELDEDTNKVMCWSCSREKIE